ncbi:S9 family peptidase [Bacillus sp. FJAT-49736]|uniref:S9 family peptidase n=1 Tax=Bacillus sp. FJAT-49736 TaxID=2833582 RepID=UPI001BCA0253|nr:S9 family peptidase [Bacillus sp. FJAT-49736]MBS4172752.1 S9 family peptidase [Bacillus sp. FJAT-49736]
MKWIDVKPYLHVRSAGNPVYHPNGSTLTFITNYTGIPQVWELGSDTNWPSQVSFTEERVIFVKYISGTNNRIIGMDAGVNEKQQLFLLDEYSDLIPLTNSPEHIHEYGGSSPDGKWIAWSSNRRHPAFFDLYIQDLNTLEFRQVFSEDGTYSVVKWHPSGKFLLIQKTTSNLDNDLGLLEIETGNVRWLTEHEGEAIFLSPQFSKDGDHLYVLTNVDREYIGLADLDLNRSTMTWLDERDWDLEELTLSNDKNLLAYSVNEGGVSKGVLYNIANKTYHSWEAPIGSISGLTFSPDDSKLAYVFNGPKHPSDIWELELKTNTTKRRTFVSQSSLIEEQLVEPELIHFRSFDNLEIPAFYYKPKHQMGKMPVVVFVHGGPESQIRAVYNPFLQYFLNRGYAVCTPNVRGSTGYGKTYTHLDDVRKRMDSVRDLTELVKWLTTNGNADPDRIAIMGRSYGGFMVLAAITHYPELWSAAIDIVGISSFKTFLENTGSWRRKLRELEYGSIEEDGEFFEEIDPIHRTKDITSPLMVLHGANDPRVPIEEAEQIVKELKERNHPVTYIRFEDEGHFFVKLKNNITAYTGVADFLDCYIGKK